MRLELTKKTDLAFKALECIHVSHGKRVTGTVLAEKLEITTQYLPHVMAPLTRAGWVASTSGPKGGYTIDSDLMDVSLLDLIVAVEGEIDDSRCLHLGPKHHSDYHCALHSPWIRARRALLGVLDDSNLAEMVAASN